MSKESLPLSFENLAYPANRFLVQVAQSADYDKSTRSFVDPESVINLYRQTFNITTVPKPVSYRHIRVDMDQPSPLPPEPVVDDSPSVREIKSSVSNFLDWAIETDLVVPSAVNKIPKIEDYIIEIRDKLFLDLGGVSLLHLPQRYLALSASVVDDNYQELLGVLSRVKTTIDSTDKLFTAVRTAAAVHEWAHGFEDSICSSDDKCLFRQALIHTPRLIPGLAVPDQLFDIHKERFAKAFEYQALLFGLSQITYQKIVDGQLGVLPSDAVARIIINSYRTADAQLLDDFRQLRKSLSSVYSDTELSHLTMDLSLLFIQHGITPKYIPQLWLSLGYYGAYSPDQIRQMTTAALDQV